MAAQILPRHTRYNWQPWAGHFPPPGLLQTDAGWYAHALGGDDESDSETSSSSEGGADLLEGALDDLYNWVHGEGARDEDGWHGGVRARVPPGHRLEAFFDVVGEDEDGDEQIVRIGYGATRLGAAGWLDELRGALEDALEAYDCDISPRELRMFVRVVSRRRVDVKLVGGSDDSDSDDDDSSSDESVPPPRARGRPRNASPAGPSRAGRAAASSGRRALHHERQLYPRGHKNMSKLAEAMAEAVYGGLAHRGAPSEQEKAAVAAALASLFEVRGDGWAKALERIEERHEAGVSVYDGATKAVLREGAPEFAAQYHLVRDGADGAFRAIKNVTAWLGLDAVHQCPNCAYTSARAANVAAHVASGVCMVCPHCSARCGSHAALREHLASYEAAPCAKPVGDPAIKCKLLPRHRNDSLTWDIETRPDARNKSRAIVVCAAPSASVAALLRGVDLEAAGGMSRAERRDGKWVLDTAGTHDAPYLYTRCVVADEPEAVARACFEQFLATLDALERAMAAEGDGRKSWWHTSRWSAAYYVLTEWYFVRHGEPVAVEGEADDDAPEDQEEEDEDEDGASVAPSSAASGDDATSAAQRRHATWYRRHKQAERTKLFDAVVLPALEAEGVDWKALGKAMGAARGDGVRAQAVAAFRALCAHLPPSVHGYVMGRVATFAACFDKRYKALRAQRPVTMLAHNGASFDNCGLLEHLCATGRLSCERAALALQQVEAAAGAEVEVGADVHVCAVEEAEGDDPFAPLARGEETSALDTGGERYIDVRYKGCFMFRDSFKQLAKSLEDLCIDMKTKTIKWASFPHGHLQRQETVFADHDAAFKPSRSFFEMNGKRSGPMKHKRRKLLDTDTYKALPGKCPDDPALHGPDGSRYNVYRECVEYCLDDCVSLEEAWGQWREAMVRLTRDDGAHIAHAALYRGACTVLSIDPGTVNCGVAVVRCDEETTRTVLRWDVLAKLGTTDAGAALVAYADGGGAIDIVLVEQPPLNNTELLAQVASIVRAFEARGVPVHRIDSGYAKHLDPGRDVFPMPKHYDNKKWARRFAPTLLRGVLHPPWPEASKRDDICDAVLQAWWWFDKHRLDGAGPIDPRGCPCCLRRFHTHGCDPNSVLTTGQLTLSVCKTELQCTELRLRADDSWSAVEHFKPRFLPASTQPQSLEALASELGLAATAERDCPNCLSEAIDPCRTACGHTLCRACLTRTMAVDGPPGSGACPLCREPISVVSTVSLASRAPLEEDDAKWPGEVDTRTLRRWRAARDKVPWGRVRHAAQLAKAVAWLLPDDAQAQRRALDALAARHDTHLIPVLDKAKDAFVRKAIFGGRTEPYEVLFEPKVRTACCARCSDSGGGSGGSSCGGGGGEGGGSGDAAAAEGTAEGAAPPCCCMECEWSEAAPLLEAQLASGNGAPRLDTAAQAWWCRFIDIVSMYPSEMLNDQPCGPGRWLTRAELDTHSSDPAARARFYGVLKVDVTVEKRHPIYGRYPILPERKKVNGAETLCWTCEDKVGVVYWSEELHFAEARGNVVTKVHQALAFERAPYLREFIEVFRKVKQDIDAQPKEDRNPAMRQGVKDIINCIYGKSMQRIREAEALLVDQQRFHELTVGRKRKRLLCKPRCVRDAGAESCFALTCAKPWAPARGLPPIVGVAVLGNSKCRGYTMLEAGCSLGGIPLTGDTDSLMLALPKGARLEDWRPPADATDALSCELRDGGLIHPTRFGRASHELDDLLVGVAAPLSKFYSLLLARLDGTLLTDRYLPQTKPQLTARLADLAEEDPIAEELLRAVDAMGDEEVAALAAYDADALATHWKDWARANGLSRAQVAAVAARLELTVPYVYTKLKSVRLQSNEVALNYLNVRKLVVDTHAHFERGGAPADAPKLELRRSQLKKHNFGLSFETNANRVGANYAKRVVLPRDAEWEREHAAVRITTVPHGYQGPVW